MSSDPFEDFSDDDLGYAPKAGGIAARAGMAADVPYLRSLNEEQREEEERDFLGGLAEQTAERWALLEHVLGLSVRRGRSKLPTDWRCLLVRHAKRGGGLARCDLRTAAAARRLHAARVADGHVE